MITTQLITVWQAQCLQMYTNLKMTYFPTYIHTYPVLVEGIMLVQFGR